jgi:hypothetical protein
VKPRNSQLATRLTSVFEKLDPRTMLSGDTLEAEIVNNGTGYELSITVDRTELSAQEQVVPIELTTASGEAIEGLPANFSLRVPVGSASSSGTIPLPAGAFNPGDFEDDTAIGIHRVDATAESEIVEFGDGATTGPTTGATPTLPTVPDVDKRWHDVFTGVSVVRNRTDMPLLVWNSNGFGFINGWGDTGFDRDRGDYVFVGGQWYKVSDGDMITVTNNGVFYGPFPDTSPPATPVPPTEQNPSNWGVVPPLPPNAL